MLEFKELLDSMGIVIRGILHIGAHMCEELDTYSRWNLSPNNIVWVDANERLIARNKARGIPNLYYAVMDEVSRTSEFKITNNGESSSLLELGTHAKDYPGVVVVETRKVQTTSLPEFLATNSLSATDYNLWNLDIQGVELAVLRGATSLLHHVDAIYTEINSHEVYKGCGLVTEIDALLADHGLKRVLTFNTSAGWGDALYVRVSPSSPHRSNNCPKVTLGIPTMNRFEQFLSNSLPDYLEMPGVEQIIIADENGEDNFKIRCRNWGQNSKLVLRTNPTRLGAYENKMSLLREATTDWVAIIDSDNRLNADYFTVLQNYWATNGVDTKAVYLPLDVEVVDMRSFTEVTSSHPLKGLTIMTVDKSNWNQFLRQPYAEFALNMGNCLFHKNLLEAPLEITSSVDLLIEHKVLNHQLIQHGYKLIFVPGMGYKHSVHTETISLRHGAEMTSINESTYWEIY
jgi:FkbM family methyltransferase